MKKTTKTDMALHLFSAYVELFRYFLYEDESVVDSLNSLEDICHIITGRNITYYVDDTGMYKAQLLNDKFVMCEYEIGR